MKLHDIPAGHIARNKISSDFIVIVGKYHAIQLTGCLPGYSQEIKDFHDDYEDLGKLKIKLKKIKTIKVEVSVE